MENKTCRQCSQQFIVEDADLAFYKKISPTFDGKTFEIPPPTLCPDCRHMRRLSFRNDYHLYKTKSSLSGRETLSIYSPDKDLVVYSNEEWWSDKWDPISYGLDYDSTKSFFEQFKRLQKTVPRLNLYVDNLCEGCDYSNQTSRSKNCYLVSSTVDSERCMYGFRIINSKDTLDSLFAINCELCYECVDVNGCYDCQYVQDSSNCRNSRFIFNCRGCSNCVMCQNLRDKSYYYKNKPISEENFKDLMAEIAKSNLNEIKKYKEEFNQFRLGVPVRFARLVNAENCTGHNIKNAKDCTNLFDGENIENCSYGINVNDARDCFDVNFAAANTTLHYEVMCTGVEANNIIFSMDTWPYVSNLIYCDTCSNNTSNCFGCVGLRHRQYCVLNKQYSKEEYEKLVSQIIEKMIDDGEWGEFFPLELSPYGYNETTAIHYFPMSKEQAAKVGAKWQENDFNMKFNGQYYDPLPTGEYSDPDKAQDLLNGVLRCAFSDRPFKIQSQELAFYLQNKIPIPNKHFNVRQEERFALRNPRHLWHRQCMNEGCQNEFETTYAPDRPEKVYCEKCYQKEVI